MPTAESIFCRKLAIKRYMNPTGTVALTHNSFDKEPLNSTDRLKLKQDVVHIAMESYTAMKNQN